MRQLGFSMGVALLGCLRRIDNAHGFALAFGAAGVVALAAATMGYLFFATQQKT
jgi:hypothetical protein